MKKNSSEQFVTAGNRINFFLACLFIASLFCADFSWGASPVEPEDKGKRPLFGFADERDRDARKGNMPIPRKIGEGMLQLGNIYINKQLGIVSVKGFVHQNAGEIRYLATAAKEKKEGSFLTVDTDAQTFQMALAIADILPEKENVGIWVTWSDSSKSIVKRSIGELVQVREKGKEVGEPFIFNNPYVLLDQEIQKKGNDIQYIINSEALPEKGAPVNLVVHDVRQPGRPGPEPGVK